MDRQPKESIKTAQGSSKYQKLEMMPAASVFSYPWRTNAAIMSDEESQDRRATPEKEVENPQDWSTTKKVVNLAIVSILAFITYGYEPESTP